MQRDAQSSPRERSVIRLQRGFRRASIFLRRRVVLAWPFLWAGLGLVLGSPLPAQSPSLTLLEERAFQQAVATAERSVVRIETIGGVDLLGELLTATGPTTGVVVSADGYIITSRFNFISRPTSIIVTLADERKLPARVVAEDLSRMLTLLQVEAIGLSPLSSVPADEVQVGQWAIALGRTLDARFPNLSVGIVSAVQRLQGRAIQTDAKVSPLNYGGPLIDIQGRGLGVLVPLSPQQTDEAAGVEWYDSGIGFAIPLADIERVLPRLKQGETLYRGLLGVGFKEDGPLAGTPVLAAVRAESPAAKAGLQVGDIITAADGQPTPRIPLLRRVVGGKYAGETVALTVDRKGETLEFQVELAREILNYEVPYLGILPERIAVRENNPEAGKAGVRVRYVIPESPAAGAGVRAGDVILQCGDATVTDLASLLSVLRGVVIGSPLLLKVQRGVEVLEVSLKPTPLPADLSVAPPAVEPPPAVGNLPREKIGRWTATLPGRELQYWAYVPENYHPEHPLGLLLWLHPAASPLEAELIRLCRAECDNRGIILLGPQAGQVAGWTPDDAESVAELVRSMQERYPIDPQRIAVVGHEDACSLAGLLAFSRKELFRGVALSGDVYRGQLPENVPEYRLQALTLGFAEDRNLTLVNRLTEILRKLRYPTTHVTLPGTARTGIQQNWANQILIWLDTLDRL